MTRYASDRFEPLDGGDEPRSSMLPLVEEEPSALEFLKRSLRVVFRHKLVVILGIALGVGAGYYWLDQQVQVYQARARVLVEQESPHVLGNVREVVELGSPRGYFGMQRYWTTQPEVIRSTNVARRVLTSAGLWNSEHLLGLDCKDCEFTPEQRLKALEAADMPRVLAGRIGVQALSDSMVLEITFNDSDPSFARDVTNAIAEAYVQENVAYKRTWATKAGDKLKMMLSNAEGELKQAEQSVSDFETQHRAGTIPNARKAIDARLEHLNVAINSTRNEVTSLKARADALRKYSTAKNIFSVDDAAILSHPVISSLKEQIFLLKAKLASLRVRYLTKHPDVLAVEREIRSLTVSARQEIENQATAIIAKHREARQRLTSYERQLDEAKATELSIIPLEAEYQQHVRVRDQRRKKYAELLRREIDVTTAQQVETNNVRVLEPAVRPDTPVYPRRGMTLALAALAGLLAGLGLAFLFEHADSRIRFWRDVEGSFGLKVLGIIPLIGERLRGRAKQLREHKERDLFAAHHPKSGVAEACRTLRTNLQFMATVRPINTLLVTSADPAEGKSTVIVNTAISMASSGKRVLIIEADMRRPRLKNSFELTHERGLSTCLVSGEQAEGHIHQTSWDNLDVMLCGPIPPNPAELLQTEHFKRLMAEVTSSYDFVLLDSPPTLPVADAMVLAGQVDGVLLVVRAGKTSRYALREALRHLRAIDAPLLGAVLNYQETRRGRFSRRYGYGYGYGYGGYGYGSESGEAARS